MTVFEVVGGETFFVDLVERFYVLVESDPILRPMYPADLEPGKRHLALFLSQYFGGPATYSQERGHPRLRARHMPFPIGKAERDAWLNHMLASLGQFDLPQPVQQAMADYFEDAATFMINQAEQPQ